MIRLHRQPINHVNGKIWTEFTASEIDEHFNRKLQMFISGYESQLHICTKTKTDGIKGILPASWVLKLENTEWCSRWFACTPSLVRFLSGTGFRNCIKQAQKSTGVHSRSIYPGLIRRTSLNIWCLGWGWKVRIHK